MSKGSNSRQASAVAQRRAGPAPANALPQSQFEFQQTVFQGPLPAPKDLFAYDQYLPGTADRIIAMAEREQAHRMNQEDMQARADIRHRDEVVAAQAATARGVFRSDMFGQIAGAVMGLSCLVGAVYLAPQPGMNPFVPIALVSLPVATIIKAIQNKPDKQQSPAKK